MLYLAAGSRPALRRTALLLCCWLLALAGAAQAPPGWGVVAGGSSSQATSQSITRAVATDAQGNVFVTGSFRGTVTFGATTLTSLGLFDLFVAKYVPETDTWAWAVRGGGTNADSGIGIAVSGPSVYVTGTISNNTFNTAGVLFGGSGPTANTVPQYGATLESDPDLVLAKYTDQGTSATLSWLQVGGGINADYGLGVAVRGTSVYVTGYLTNNLSNAYGVVFGASGTAPGTVAVSGASSTLSLDLLLAKYQDNGSSATLVWAQVGGGNYLDAGYGVAVGSGTSVYVTGYIETDAANSAGVKLASTGPPAGPVPVRGTAATVSRNVLVAKYQDNGPGAALVWTQVGGGTGFHYGLGLAVSGSSIYATGFITNDQANTSAVVFGDDNTTAGTVVVRGASPTASRDLLLAKYQDLGATAALRWVQVGGGTGDDLGYSVAVRAGRVYVAGSLTNNAANANGALFGSDGTATGTVTQPGVSPQSSPQNSQDLLLAKYQDNGSTGAYVWSQVGGGSELDQGLGVAVDGSSVYVAGSATPLAAFGSTTLAVPAGASLNLLAQVTDLNLLPVRPATPATAALALYPNPTAGAATLTGTAPGTAVQVLDALGRLILTATADATGMARLPGGLAPGVYVVRAGAGAGRLVVQ